VIAVSPKMLEVCRNVRKFAATDISALIMGESGTGKELIAGALHQLGNRSAGPFIAINCAAIPEALLESELFGHEKGAFTGALKTTIGRIEQAMGGTLFLDEIGDMPLPLQAKLLRFLEQRTIERVGGRNEIAVDVRIVSATNQDLVAGQTAGNFREDLYYRLAETVFDIPPLRNRDEDCLLIARHALAEQAKARGRQVPEFTKEALGAILAYAWPGNVRELQNKVRQAGILAEGRFVTAADLVLDPAADQETRPLTIKESRLLADRKTVVRAMSEANGNVAKAARILDVSRPTLYQMLQEFDLKN
jgi:two-component system NtrC family response regulator